MKTFSIVLGALVIAGLAYYFTKDSIPVEEMALTEPSTMENRMEFDFGNPKKSAHYETNTPAHGAILSGVPVNVVIDFNFDLALPSRISIMKDGTDHGVGETTIDANKLSMRRSMNPDSPDGLYRVSYNACWPDKSCHDGYFQFAIDRASASSYEDLTNRKEVTIRMSDLSFKPKNIKVSAGTKITWINDEDAEHYVNTDSHPAHTYYLIQNSRSLKKGESYEVTFPTKGFYPYHCSAHESVMKGNILVI